MKIFMAEATVGGSLEVNLPETSKTMVRYVSIQMSVYVEVGRWQNGAKLCPRSY